MHMSDAHVRTHVHTYMHTYVHTNIHAHVPMHMSDAHVHALVLSLPGGIGNTILELQTSPWARLEQNLNEDRPGRTPCCLHVSLHV